MESVVVCFKLIQLLWLVVGCKNRVLFLVFFFFCRLLSVVSVVLSLFQHVSYFQVDLSCSSSFVFRRKSLRLFYGVSVVLR